MSYTMYTPLNVWLDPASVTDVVAYIQTYLSENTIYSETEIETIIHDYLIAHPELIGGVQSVNGKTGTVVLSASDINTENNVTIESVLASLSSQISSIAASVATNTSNITGLTGRMTTAETDLTNLKSSVDELESDAVRLSIGINKFNKNDPDVVMNACVINNGSVTTNAYTTNYYATGYIPVDAETQYLWTDYQIGSTMALAFYDSSKTFLSAIVGGGTAGLVAKVGKITTPINTAFIRTTGTIAGINTAMLVEGWTTDGEYHPYEKYNPIVKIVDDNHFKTIPIYRIKSASFTSGSITLTVPNLKQKTMSFSAECNTVGTLTFANGLRLPYKSSWVLINATNVIVRSYRWTGSDVGEVTELTEAHGLDLTGFINITIIQSANQTADIILSGKDGIYQKTGVHFEGCADDVTAYCYQGSYSNVNVTVWCEQWKKDVWAFGDSYFDMWPLYAIPMGATNILYDAYTGRNSEQALSSLRLNIAKCAPKKILWCLGMNDPDTDVVNTSWKTCFDTVNEICAEKGIEMIGCTIPNTPTQENSYKNAVIKSSGLRYVDIAAAVGASESSSSWFTGLLSSDNVHPTELGRKVIASAMIASVPEILS